MATALGVSLRLAKPPSAVEDETSYDHRSPENGGPNADRLANEPCDDNREQESRVAPKYEDGSTAESAHAK